VTRFDERMYLSHFPGEKHARWQCLNCLHSTLQQLLLYSTADCFDNGRAALEEIYYHDQMIFPGWIGRGHFMTPGLADLLQNMMTRQNS